VRYEGRELGELHLDLVVGDRIVVELKAVEAVHDLHLAQLVSYLRAGQFPLGLLINFNVPVLRDGIYRRVHSQALLRAAPP
jgi:GxxExxY protein